MKKRTYQNLYCAVILAADDNDSIIDTWAEYADSIREVRSLFEEEHDIRAYESTYGRIKVMFRLMKEG